ncbi:MAG: hypothetical protein MUC96_32865 [Myxococcaceae bacterium]|jgi:hypothetical protein|nr:hypothetical protein [Myxococcaceae bacterium]
MTSPRSFFAVEVTIFPPARACTQHVVTEVSELEQVLAQLLANPDRLWTAHELLLWVVQRGEVVKVLDLLEFVRAHLGNGQVLRLRQFHLSLEGSTADPRMAAEFGRAALSLPWNEIAEVLPTLEAPHLEPKGRAEAILPASVKRPPAVVDSLLFPFEHETPKASVRHGTHEVTE